MTSQKSQWFRAVLDHPVGINASYRIGFNKRSRKRVVIKSRRALGWEDMALVTLKDNGFTVQPEQPYWCSVRLDLYTSRLDIDAPVKSTLDLIMKALSRENRVNNRRIYVGVEDKWFGQLIVHKHFCSPKAQQRIEIEIEVVPIKNKGEFNRITNDRRNRCFQHNQPDGSKRDTKTTTTTAQRAKPRRGTTSPH